MFIRYIANTISLLLAMSTPVIQATNIHSIVASSNFTPENNISTIQVSSIQGNNVSISMDNDIIILLSGMLATACKLF